MPAPPPIHRDADGRPDFMVVLGIAPPYVEEDVKQAYFAKAKELHPDHGGNAHDFAALHEAFQQAQQYLEFRKDSRGWIARQMDGYLHSRQVIEQLEKCGAKVETNMIDWLQRSFGDFAELTDAIIGVRLENSQHAEQMIEVMVTNHAVLDKLTRLELPGCQLGDEMALQLATFQQVQQLDISGTQVTKAVLELADALPALVSFDVTGTNVGWWARKKLASLLVLRREEIPTLVE
jgi:DnaJ-class molecular chaperone